MFEVFIAAAALLMVAYIAVLYMAGSFMQKPEWHAMAKDQLRELFLACLITMSAGAMISICNYLGIIWLQSYFPSYSIVQNDLGKTTSAQLEQIIFKSLIPMIARIGSIDMLTTTASSYYAAAGPGKWRFDFKVFNAAGDRFLQIIGILEFTLSITLASLFIQSAVLDMAYQVSMEIMLPLGAVLLFFPVLRKSGKFIVALAIAYGFFAPFIYSMTLASIGDFFAMKSASSPAINIPFIGAYDFWDIYSTPFIRISEPFLIFLPTGHVFVLVYSNLFAEAGKVLFITVLCPALVSIITVSTIRPLADFIEAQSFLIDTRMISGPSIGG
ncbi:MAG: hypothetical protein QW035_02865 [Candidatus Anstonellales archaeon]